MLSAEGIQRTMLRYCKYETGLFSLDYFSERLWSMSYGQNGLKHL